MGTQRAGTPRWLQLVCILLVLGIVLVIQPTANDTEKRPKGDGRPLSVKPPVKPDPARHAKPEPLPSTLQQSGSPETPLAVSQAFVESARAVVPEPVTVTLPVVDAAVVAAQATHQPETKPAIGTAPVVDVAAAKPRIVHTKSETRQEVAENAKAAVPEPAIVTPPVGDAVTAAARAAKAVRSQLLAARELAVEAKESDQDSERRRVETERGELTRQRSAVESKELAMDAKETRLNSTRGRIESVKVEQQHSATLKTDVSNAELELKAAEADVHAMRDQLQMLKAARLTEAERSAAALSTLSASALSIAAEAELGDKMKELEGKALEGIQAEAVAPNSVDKQPKRRMYRDGFDVPQETYPVLTGASPKPRICVHVVNAIENKSETKTHIDPMNGCKPAEEKNGTLKGLVTVVFLQTDDDGHGVGKVEFGTTSEKEVSVLTMRPTEVLSRVQTEYILLVPLAISRLLTADVSLRRLVEVAEGSGANFVGGSMFHTETMQLAMPTCIKRIVHAHWQVTFETGYDESDQLDALKCRAMPGPVLARRSALVATPLRDLPAKFGLLEDVFMRQDPANSTMLSAGDSMFECHVNMPVRPSKTLSSAELASSWQTFMELHQIEVVKWSALEGYRGSSQDSLTVQMGCSGERGGGYGLHTRHREMGTGLSMPPCEMKDYCALSTCVMDGLNKIGVRATHSDGSGLGALKFGMPLPWEGDFDVCVHKHDSQTFKAKFKKVTAYCTEATGKAVRDTMDINVASGLLSHVDFFTPLGTKAHVYVCGDQLGGSSWKTTGRTTSMRFCGRWLNTELNPAAFHRSKFGHSFRHAESWILGSNSAWLYTKFGFSNCSETFRGHNACLKGLIDGDLSAYPFTEGIFNSTDPQISLELLMALAAKNDAAAFNTTTTI